ncbi:MAG: UDP-N-acetylmuramoyl-L-alanyl-D-glutamate--2,6-diaminopimelate ligase [Lachnospiraceae bacterium]|nr:UDP-N-acetylmuramoyl-L-alanyl-D-glutamate--2,6-diaminopimelate ligase [Lachnospiraceae bacterium]
MKLKDLLADVEVRAFCGDEQKEITSVAYDSRKVERGSLFVCIRGLSADGHDFIQNAIEKGAVAIVAEEAPEVSTDTSMILVPDTRSALAAISATWFRYPARKMTLMGLTGTKGKTTTAVMIKRILEKSGYKTGMIGTLGAFIGDEKIEFNKNTPTTPEAYELHSLFADMLRAGCQYVVMEVSSQGLKQKRTEGIMFDYSAFLNISPDHIGKGEHENFEEYLECKKMLFSQSRYTVANIDDSRWKEVTENALNLVTVSVGKEADYMGEKVENLWEPGVLGASFRISGRMQGEIVLNMPGRFNVENALVAAAMTSLAGAAPMCIKAALKEVTVKGRMQVLPGVSEHAVFLIDYAHNALSMESLLQTLKNYHPVRLICLFGGGGNRPRQRRLDMGRIAGQYADMTIITMDNPRYESMDQINEDILEGLKVYDGAYKIIKDREEAIKYLIDNCAEGDIVALIGKGHEEYQEIEGVKYHFSEEEIVREYVKQKSER